MSATDGGPAFPREDYQADNAPGQRGMSLRDYFAGQALAAFAGNEAAGVYFGRDKKKLATNCYELADAMLIVRLGVSGNVDE